MEFKGTKGKWINSSNAVHNEKGKCVCITYENRRVDALLISKSPEMLEMLQWFVENFEGVFHEGTETDNKVKEVKQLIKQATEL